MSLIKCPSCGVEISEAAPQCPKCGAPRIQTIPMNDSYVPSGIQNNPYVQPLDKENNIFGILSVVLAALYFLSKILVLVYGRYWVHRGEVLMYLLLHPSAIRIADRVVTIILLVGFIFTWYISYKKEKDQKLRMIGTFIIAIAPIVSVLLSLLLEKIIYN